VCENRSAISVHPRAPVSSRFTAHQCAIVTLPRDPVIFARPTPFPLLLPRACSIVRLPIMAAARALEGGGARTLHRCRCPARRSGGCCRSFHGKAHRPACNGCNGCNANASRAPRVSACPYGLHHLLLPRPRRLNSWGSAGWKGAGANRCKVLSLPHRFSSSRPSSPARSPAASHAPLHLHELEQVLVTLTHRRHRRGERRHLLLQRTVSSHLPRRFCFRQIRDRSVCARVCVCACACECVSV